MLSKSKISKGYLTVVPKAVRKATKVREGDILEWSLEGEKIIIRPRRRRTLEDITGLIAHGGDAVRSKRRVQRASE